MPYPLWPAVITLLSLCVLIWTMFIVGHYRKKYNIVAPATSGNPMFDRAYRVQMNTIESVILFLPALWLAARWGSWYVIPVAGALWLVGRIVYGLAYLKDPARRGVGFGMSFIAVIALMIDAAVGMARGFLV